MFVAKKPCNFAGKRFAIGEQIPEELIDDSRKRTLLKFGTIAQVDAPEGENRPNTPVTDENGEKPIETTEGGKTDVKSPLNGKAKTAGTKPAAAKTKQKGGK